MKKLPWKLWALFAVFGLIVLPLAVLSAVYNVIDAWLTFGWVLVAWIISQLLLGIYLSRGEKKGRTLP